MDDEALNRRLDHLLASIATLTEGVEALVERAEFLESLFEQQPHAGDGSQVLH